MQKQFSAYKNDQKTFKLYHKVRDHCHYTGKVRGAAQSICNLRQKTPKEIPVLFIIVLHMIIILNQTTSKRI